jgi:Gram-negative porin
MRMHISPKLAALALAAAGAALAATAARADTSINGTVYADFTDKQNKDKATDTKSSDSGVGTDVKRFYFTVTHEFDSVWSAQFQSDIGDQGAKRYDVFVKKAYVKAKLAPELSLLLGSANTPWVPYVDDLYGFRYVENTLTDRLNFGTSADWGVHALGAFGGKLINYDVAADNGRGYSNPTRSKSVDFEGRLGIEPLAGLHFAVGGYTGKRGLETFSAPAQHTATRFDVLAAYRSDVVRLGGEYFQAKNWNNVTTAATDKADGFSIWGSIAPTPSLAVFGRYDNAKPSKDLKPHLEDNYFDVGVQWRANKSFAASLVYKYEEVKDGSISTTNGTIGSASSTHKGDYNEIGLWTLYTF